MTSTILGANGKLGAILSHFAARAGLPWQTQARDGSADIMWSGDMHDPAAGRIFTKGATLINMIGQTATTRDGFQDSNVRFVRDLLSKATQTGVAHVVLASSAAVYGAGDETPFVEDTPLHPVTPYGISKATMEDVAHTFSKDNDAPAITILRIGNVGGADALSAFAERHIAAGTSMPLHRFTDGTAPLRSYIGPRDLFNVIRALALPHKGPPRVVNVTHPQPLALDAVLNAYRTHLMPDLRWVDTPAPIEALRSVTLSTENVQKYVSLAKYGDPADAMARQISELLT